MKDIEALLNKYFEGETNCEEERELRRFFTQGIVPEHLQVYRPMFAFYEAEHTEYTKIKTFKHYLTYSLGTVAACLLILLGVSGVYRHLSPNPTNYVVIDGKRYTDANLIREQAKAAFRDVSLSEEEVFATLFE